jgi:ABC-2 type transport system permease protein
MTLFTSLLWIETRKALRSRIPLFTLLGFLMIPVATAFMVFVTKNPELSRSLGLISAKANLAGVSADWPFFLGMIAQAVAMGGLILYGIILSWVFGREFADGTAKDLLALPVARWSILAAKFCVCAAWFLALVVIAFLFSLLSGAWIGLPPVASLIFLDSGLQLAPIILGVVLAGMPAAFFAGIGRGYLLPVGMMVLLMVFGTIASVVGWGEICPWAVPGLLAKMNPGELLGWSSWLAVLLCGLISVGGTVAWWQFADQNR